jgi:zinc transport system ATP-binding protein
MKSLDRTFPARALELGFGAAFLLADVLGAADRRRALDALDRVGAAHLASRQISHLSGGELQRVYLARTFIHSPRLVLLDEPATGIDAPGEADLYRILDSYRSESGATILMITHDWEVAYHTPTAFCCSTAGAWPTALPKRLCAKSRCAPRLGTSAMRTPFCDPRRACG